MNRASLLFLSRKIQHLFPNLSLFLFSCLLFFPSTCPEDPHRLSPNLGEKEDDGVHESGGNLRVAGEHCKGEDKEEQEADAVLEQHVGEDVDVVGEQPVGNDHVGSAAEEVEEGEDAKEG